MPGRHALVSLLITLVIFAPIYYFIHPAVNIQNPGFWGMTIVFMLVYLMIKGIRIERSHEDKESAVLPAYIFIALICLFLLARFADSRIFHAKKYSSILTVQEADIDSIPTVSASSAIALMDTQSAEKLGDRKIGSLSHVVSQFNVGSYMQINYQGSPVKVAALAYDGFFKWYSNHKTGVPGYVLVDPVSMSAEYTALQEKLRYVPSAYFNEDLDRHIRFRFPTVMYDGLHFEIDENGKAWYVASVYKHTVGLFGGKQVTGAIVADPVSGEVTKYDAADVPDWVDIVYSGDLICMQYNDYGRLSHGFLNSMFSQADCKQVTTLERRDDDGDTESYSDYGYIAIGNDIWIYTGVTSVNGDSSNIGFILSNERTEETKYILCAGADEFSAMRSAQGEVQEKGYVASFPSLINVDGVLTYIMVLKDGNDLVKMYSAVNVEQYNTVAVGTTQIECLNKYRKLIGAETPADEKSFDGFEEKTITVTAIESIVIGGDTWIYVADEEKNIYRAEYSDVIEMMFVKTGDTLTIYTDGDNFILQAQP
ncbi:MAG: hypothetical protein K6G61_06640 [Solobacterium sp.]|nr:hypothetical protein [Solobacterium sp.]